MRRRRTPFANNFTTALAAAALLLGGCGKRDTVELRVAVIGTGPLALGDPLAVPASEAQAVVRLNTAQGLVNFNSSGQIEPGLAERWNVSDDGLSYIFRLAAGEWPDGRAIMARDIARILKRQLRAADGNATRDALGAVLDVQAMTDRVIEITLAAPRPNLLELLAQPEFALIREGVGTGPFKPRVTESGEEEEKPADGAIQLTRRLPDVDGERGARENVIVAAMPAPRAIANFLAGKLDLVIGGTIADLPLAKRAQLPRGALRFDPARGLFGLQPVRATGPLESAELRLLLSEAIDRDALIAALGVPGLVPRASLLQAGLDGVRDPVQPPWLAAPLAERRPALQQRSAALFADGERPRLRLFLPDGPGGDLLFARLSADWGALGIGVERTPTRAAADLAWLDVVAPSNSPAWYLRQFRCAAAPVCVAEADPLLDTARAVIDPVQRAALLADAGRMMDEAGLFIAIAAPVRWSLVGDRAAGYQDNRFARHPFAGLMRRARGI
jgi:peptide/nickel transport system substrate-binding protein